MQFIALFSSKIKPPLFAEKQPLPQIITDSSLNMT